MNGILICDFYFGMFHMQVQYLPVFDVQKYNYWRNDRCLCSIIDSNRSRKGRGIFSKRVLLVHSNI